jgi:hypothetical protein
MPTWEFPSDKKLIRGIIFPDEFEKKLKKINSFGETDLPTRKNVPLELTIPEIAPLEKYGKNFPNGKGFEIANSWNEVTKKEWGDDITNSGTLGREFGPGNVNKIYSNNYLNNIRMAVPGGDLETALSLNRNCNILNKDIAKTQSTGLIFDSKNQQIVPMNNFGNRFIKNKNNFGNLYNQMGPAFEVGNEYLVDKNTVSNLYGGATQNEPVRPTKVNNNNIYVGQSDNYNPLIASRLVIKPPYNNNSIGQKKKKKNSNNIGQKKNSIGQKKNSIGQKVNKIGEGTLFTIKNNKIKVKN